MLGKIVKPLAIAVTASLIRQNLAEKVVKLCDALTRYAARRHLMHKQLPSFSHRRHGLIRLHTICKLVLSQRSSRGQSS